MLLKRSFMLRWWGLSIWLLGAALLPMPSMAQTGPAPAANPAHPPIPLLA